MRKQRYRPQSNAERRQIQTQERKRQPAIRPGGVNFTPINDNVINQMYTAMSAQSPQTSTPLYPPGAPIRPVPGITPLEGPRVFTYPVGYNISQLPRSTEAYSFADLRALASTYYGIQMCQQVWFDYISKLELVIEPRPDLIGEDNDISQYEGAIQFYQDFFAYPDKELDLKAWMRKAVKDQLEIDALSIFVRKDKAGRPYSLDIIDGAMIKPLIDDRGRRPQPPYPAYEQFWQGVPACLLTSDDLIYVKETERADSVYGLSRVEKIILNINIALRKQTKDLARFTDGTLPAGFITPEMDVQWTQEEIEAFEIQLNTLLAGNDELRARIKVLPRGFVFQSTDDPDIHVDLDTHLLNITASMHGLTMAELAFIADVNRSSGETQENVVYRRAMGPLMNRYAEIFTMILRKYFKETRFVAKWKGFEEHEDFQMQASAYSTLTGAGIISPSRAAHLMHLPVDVDLPSPIIVTKSGPILLEDFANPKLRQAQMDAQLAGLTLAKQGGPEQGNDTEDEEEDTPLPAKARQGKAKEDEESPAVKRLITQVEELVARLTLAPESHENAKTAALRQQGVEHVMWQSKCSCAVCQQNNGVTRAPGEAFPSGHVLPPCHEGCDCGTEQVQETEKDSEQERRAEYRRWKERAIDDMKRGRKQRGFTTTILSEEAHRAISSELAGCKTAEDVRAVFERAKERDARPKALASTASGSVSGGNQLRSKSDWRPKW